MPPVYGTSQDDDLDKSTASSGQMINTLQGDDTVIGSEFDDRIYLGSGDDSAQGGGGNDIVVGGDGTDTAIYRGSIFDFTWSEIRTDILQVTDTNASDGDDGTDTLRGIEQLQFDDFVFVIGGANAAYATVSDQVTDEDTAHSFMVQAWDFDGGDVSIHSITGASGGSFSVDGFTSLSSGMGVGKEFSISFDPGADYHHLGANESLIEDIEVVISDGQGNFTTKTFQMTIDGVNDDPTAAGVTYNQTSVQEDGSLIATGAAIFDDVDQGDVLSYSVQGGGAGTYGSLSINSDGEWTYNLNNAASNVQALNSGQTVQDTFTIEVDDGNGGLATQDVTISVDGASDALRIGILGGNRFESFLDQNGHDASVVASPSDRASLDQYDVIVLNRVSGTPEIVDWVHDGGLLITEWGAAGWAINTTGMVDADSPPLTPSGAYDYVSGDTEIIFSQAGIDAGLSDNIGNSFSKNGSTDFFWPVSNLGPDVEVLAYHEGRGVQEPVVFGDGYGAGTVLVMTHDWQDQLYNHHDGLDGNEQLLLNAVHYDYFA